MIHIISKQINKIITRKLFIIQQHHHTYINMLRPTGVIQNWDLRKTTPKDLIENSTHAISIIQDYSNKVASTKIFSYETVLKPILEIYRICGDRGTIGSLTSFPKYVAESEELRAASTDAMGVLLKGFVEMEMRKDIFDILVKYHDEYVQNDNLSIEQMKALDRLILNGRRKGLQLSEDIRDIVKDCTQQINILQLEFEKNICEEKTILLFTKDELDGLDAIFINSLEQDNDTGKYKLSLKYPHYLPAIRKCIHPNTRQKLELAYNSRCIHQNTNILEQIIELREKQTKCLGYDNFAAYEQEILMAKNPETVNSFLTELNQKLQPLWEKEKEYLLQLKMEECKKYNYEFDGKINMWDFGYYLNMSTEKKYCVDENKLKEYFPLSIVTTGLLNIYQELLGLKFNLITNAEKWNDDVQMYSVNDIETDELLGYFYLDLFPREGKYGHACCEPIQQGCLDENGIKQLAICVMICNFPCPMGNQPSLLSHDDVETFFHEFGHCMHAICCRAETPLFFGTRVSTDFLEAPSQMLENWVWEKESLQKMSLHYDTKTPIPDELLENLLNSRNANSGAHNLRQMVYATIDQRIHKQGRYELSQMYSDVMKEIMGLDTTPGTNSLASFSHICGGYEARYYSYLWSEVYSMDMYATVFKKQGILNPIVGKYYRKCILEPGGSIDALEILKTFLKKEPSNHAFLKSKGL